jgi:hypothetical protein
MRSSAYAIIVANCGATAIPISGVVIQTVVGEPSATAITASSATVSAHDPASMAPVRTCLASTTATSRPSVNETQNAVFSHVGALAPGRWMPSAYVVIQPLKPISTPT